MAEKKETKKSVLRDAPREIRDLIYDQALAIDTMIWRADENGCKVTSQCRLLSTNKQLRAEYRDSLSGIEDSIQLSHAHIKLGLTANAPQTSEKRTLFQLYNGANIPKAALDSMFSPLLAPPATTTRDLCIKVTIDETFGFRTAKPPLQCGDLLRDCLRALRDRLQSFTHTHRIAIEMDFSAVAKHDQRLAKVVAVEVLNPFLGFSISGAPKSMTELAMVTSNLDGFYLNEKSDDPVRFCDLAEKRCEEWVALLREMGATRFVE